MIVLRTLKTDIIASAASAHQSSFHKKGIKHWNTDCMAVEGLC